MTFRRRETKAEMCYVLDFLVCQLEDVETGIKALGSIGVDFKVLDFYEGMYTEKAIENAHEELSSLLRLRRVSYCLKSFIRYFNAQR